MDSTILKNPKGKYIERGQKLMAYNVYQELVTNGTVSKSKSVEITANELGISTTSVWKIIKEMEDKGTLRPPIKTRKRSTFLEKLNEEQRRTFCQIIQDIVKNEFLPTIQKIVQALSVNETLPQLGRTSVWRILKKLGFIWTKQGHLVPKCKNMDLNKVIMNYNKVSNSKSMKRNTQNKSDEKFNQNGINQNIANNEVLGSKGVRRNSNVKIIENEQTDKSEDLLLSKSAEALKTESSQENYSISKKRMGGDLYSRLTEDEKNAIIDIVDSILIINEIPTAERVYRAVKENKLIPNMYPSMLYNILKKLGFMWNERGELRREENIHNPNLHTVYIENEPNDSYYDENDTTQYPESEIVDTLNIRNDCEYLDSINYIKKEYDQENIIREEHNYDIKEEHNFECSAWLMKNEPYDHYNENYINDQFINENTEPELAANVSNIEIQQSYCDNLDNTIDVKEEYYLDNIIKEQHSYENTIDIKTDTDSTKKLNFGQKYKKLNKEHLFVIRNALIQRDKNPVLVNKLESLMQKIDLKCIICDVRFSEEKELKNHCDILHRPWALEMLRNIFCPICKGWFNIIEDYNEHFQENCGQEYNNCEILCSLCGQIFENNTCFLKHENLHLLNQEIPPYAEIPDTKENLIVNNVQLNKSKTISYNNHLAIPQSPAMFNSFILIPTNSLNEQNNVRNNIKSEIKSGLINMQSKQQYLTNTYYLINMPDFIMRPN